MNQNPLRPITDEERREYRDNGAVCLRGLFDADWVELLRVATEEIMTNPTELSIDHQASTGTFFSAIYVWRDNDAFRRFEFDSPLAQICADLMDSQTGRIYHDHLLVKEPGTDAPTPWHQDQSYFHVDGEQLCSLWLALDPVSVESGGVQFIKGSQTWGWFDPNVFKPGQEQVSEFPPAPNVEAHLGDYELLSWELEPGDCTVHHGLTFHGGYANSSAERRRRGLSVRIAGDDTTFADRKKAHALPCDPGLAAGSPLNSELFPLVWPRKED